MEGPVIQLFQAQAHRRQALPVHRRTVRTVVTNHRMIYAKNHQQLAMIHGPQPVRRAVRHINFNVYQALVATTQVVTWVASYYQLENVRGEFIQQVQIQL